MTESRASSLPLRIETLGETGDPLILIHGFGATSFTWRFWAPELARSHRVFLVEPEPFQPGEEPFPDYHTPLGQARLVHTLIRQKDLRRVTIIGHSLGGGIALLTALESMDQGEDRLQGLVLVAGAAYPQSMPRYIGLARVPLLGEAMLQLIPSRWLIRKVLHEICYAPESTSESQVEAYSAPLRSRAGRYGLIRMARQIIPEGVDEITGRFRDIRVPTLLLWGREDPIVRLEIAERLERELPDATLVVLDRCGHDPPEELPEASLDAVRRFLSRIYAPQEAGQGAPLARDDSSAGPPTLPEDRVDHLPPRADGADE